MLEWGDRGLKSGEDVLDALNAFTGDPSNAAYRMHDDMKSAGERFTGLLADALDVLRAQVRKMTEDREMLAQGLGQMIEGLGQFYAGGPQALAADPKSAMGLVRTVRAQLDGLAARPAPEIGPEESNPARFQVQNALVAAKIPYTQGIARSLGQHGPADILEVGKTRLAFKQSDGSFLGILADTEPIAQGGGKISVEPDLREKIVRMQVGDKTHALSGDSATQLARRLLNAALKVADLAAAQGPLSEATLGVLQAYVRDAIAMTESLVDDEQIGFAMVARGVALQREMLNRGLPLTEVAKIEVILGRYATPPVAAPGVGFG